MSFKDDIKTITDDEIIKELKELGVSDVILEHKKSVIELITTIRKLLKSNPNKNLKELLKEKVKIEKDSLKSFKDDCSIKINKAVNIFYDSGSYSSIYIFKDIYDMSITQTYQILKGKDGKIKASNIEASRKIEIPSTFDTINIYNLGYIEGVNGYGLARVFITDDLEETSNDKSREFILTNPDIDSFDTVGTIVVENSWNLDKLKEMNIDYREGITPEIAEGLISKIEGMANSEYKMEFVKGDYFYSVFKPRIFDFEEIMINSKLDENLKKSYRDRFNKAILQYINNDEFRDIVLNTDSGSHRKVVEILNRLKIPLEIQAERTIEEEQK